MVAYLTPWRRTLRPPSWMTSSQSLLESAKCLVVSGQSSFLWRRSASLNEQNDYVVGMVGGRHEHFPKSNKELHGVPAPDLQRLAVNAARASSLALSPGPS